jgi:hypothetical protein
MDVAEKVSIKSLPRLRSDKEASISQSLAQAVTIDGNGFEIMANVIWEEIGRAIMDELGGIVFSAGRPNEFRKVSGTTEDNTE